MRYDLFTEDSSDLVYYNDKDVPNSIFIATNGEIYTSGGMKISIYQWLWWSWKLEKRNIDFNEKESCFGLFIDIEDTIYCSLKGQHKVIKKLFGKNTDWQPAAGTVRAGGELNMLFEPHGIFVDVRFNLYVADCGNNRIQLFKPEDKNGEKVVNSTVIIDGHDLLRPTAVILDADNNLYIADSGNHRIVFVTSSFNEYKCLVGCSGKAASDSARLSNPTSISFDRSGNIVVGDTSNSRLQKFALATEYCGELSKY
jgi:hypothetical protein